MVKLFNYWFVIILTDPNARRTRVFYAGQAGEKMVDQTHEKMWLYYYEVTAGPRKQDINAKVTREIGATVRSKVHMIAPSFLELPPHEQYRVINNLSVSFSLIVKFFSLIT